MKAILLCLFFLIMTCVNAYANSHAGTIYTYYDAARNKYVLIKNGLKYIPIVAKESSSGMYSGGSNKSKILTNKESDELVQLFKNAITDKKAHTNKNIKPNAAVEIISKNKKINFLLQSTSPVNILLNNYLKQIIKN